MIRRDCVYTVEGLKLRLCTRKVTAKEGSDLRLYTPKPLTVLVLANSRLSKKKATATDLKLGFVDKVRRKLKDLFTKNSGAYEKNQDKNQTQKRFRGSFICHLNPLPENLGLMIDSLMIEIRHMFGV